MENTAHGFYICTDCRRITLLQEIEGDGCIFCHGYADWIQLGENEPGLRRVENGGIVVADRQPYWVSAQGAAAFPTHRIFAGSHRAAILAFHAESIPFGTGVATYTVKEGHGTKDERTYIYDGNMEPVEENHEESK